MHEVSAGLWHWQARHPEWAESAPWDPMVSSYAIDDGERLLLFDPLGVPEELVERAGERETAIVLTAPWHERDSQSLVQRLGVPVYTPRADTAEDLLRQFNFTAPEGWISADVRWLVEGEGEAYWYSAGDRLPGVEAFPGQKHNDLVLWVESHRAVVAGDTLADFGEGPRINPRWLNAAMTRERVLDGLHPLLALPVEHLLETHGGPYDRTTLERALS